MTYSDEAKTNTELAIDIAIIIFLVGLIIGAYGMQIVRDKYWKNEIELNYKLKK